MYSPEKKTQSYSTIHVMPVEFSSNILPPYVITAVKQKGVEIKHGTASQKAENVLLQDVEIFYLNVPKEVSLKKTQRN